jgi:hypothetical protein
MVAVPGMLAAVVVAYTLFFTGENLLDVNLLVYFAPLVSMLVTLALIGKNVSFADIPGFDRLSGLMVLIGVSFAIALAVHRARIWVIFGGSIELVLAIALFLFLLLKWATHMLFRRSEEPGIAPPRFR